MLKKAIKYLKVALVFGVTWAGCYTAAKLMVLGLCAIFGTTTSAIVGAVIVTIISCVTVIPILGRCIGRYVWTLFNEPDVGTVD